MGPLPPSCSIQGPEEVNKDSTVLMLEEVALTLELLASGTQMCSRPDRISRTATTPASAVPLCLQVVRELHRLLAVAATSTSHGVAVPLIRPEYQAAHQLVVLE